MVCQLIIESWLTILVLNVLNKLSKSQDCLEQCAQIAFQVFILFFLYRSLFFQIFLIYQKNKPKIAIQALECLLSVMTNDLQNIKLGEISKVLRTLIKLCLQGHEPEIPPGRYLPISHI